MKFSNSGASRFNLVDARRVKNVSGRRSDVLDCQWVQELHTYGLLAKAFRPAEEVCILRGYLRQKEMLVQTAAMHIQHMQKALQQMNLLLHNVVPDITGATGMKILKAIIAGERNPKVLAKERDPRCRNSSETIAKSLVGNYRPEHLFALRQAVELYEIYQTKIADCEAAIVAYLEQQDHRTDDEPPAPQRPISARDRVRAGSDIRAKLYKRARSGGREAITATAHKIARIFYSMLKNGTAYVEIGQANEQKFKERRLRSLKQQATAFGFQLTPIAAGSF